MATIIDVAKYIIQKQGRMTTMKLQKLAYYCQAWSLAWDEEPLFNEDFEAWANGPVCHELFNFHKGLFVVDKINFENIPNYDFNEKQKETIDNVLAYYGHKEPLWLSELTHKEYPWLFARGNTPIGMPCSKIISKDSMQQYYGGLATKQ